MGKWPIDTSAPARKERPHRPWHAGHAAFPIQNVLIFALVQHFDTLKGYPGAASNVFIKALKAY